MRTIPLLASAVAMSIFSMGAALAKAPAGATGECKDGTYTEAKSREGACSSHGGLKSWSGPETAARPAGATGECKDGTYTDAASKSGACSGHKGVKEWFGAAPAAPEKTSKTSKKTEEAPSAPTPKQTQAPGPSSDRPTKAQPSAAPYQRPANPVAGGGNGKVWVNTGTKVYHCEGDEWYGKTKKGEYLSESAAKSSGARPARGKVCS